MISYTENNNKRVTNKRVLSTDRAHMQKAHVTPVSKTFKSKSQDRDPNLDHPAVILYRKAFRLCPNWGYRRDIVVTVTDLDLFAKVLELWKDQQWNPLKIGWMLSEYERRENR